MLAPGMAMIRLQVNRTATTLIEVHMSSFQLLPIKDDLRNEGVVIQVGDLLDSKKRPCGTMNSIEELVDVHNPRIRRFQGENAIWLGELGSKLHLQILLQAFRDGIHRIPVRKAQCSLSPCLSMATISSKTSCRVTGTSMPSRGPLTMLKVPGCELGCSGISSTLWLVSERGPTTCQRPWRDPEIYSEALP